MRLSIDLRASLRSIRRRWFVYTALSVLLSAATTTNLILFTIEDALLFRPLRVERPENVVLIRSRFAISAQEPTPVSAGQVDAMAAARLTSLDAVAGVGSNRPCRLLDEGGRSIETSCTPVTAGFFQVIGAGGMRGRVFRAEDFREAAIPVVISAELAHQLLRSSGSDAMGTTLLLKGTVGGVDEPRLRVVGVAAEGLHLPDNTHIWLPEFERTGSVNAHLAMWGRLRPGSTLQAARQDLSAGGFKDWHGDPLDLEPLGPWLVGEGRSSILLLFIASTLLLVLAWLHGLNVLGARLSGAEHEIATRFALGGSEWRVARQFALEGVLLGGVSTVAGLLAAGWWLPRVVELLPATARRHVDFDWTMVAWATLIFVTASTLFVAGTWALVRKCARGTLHAGPATAGRRRSATLEAIQAATVAGSTAVVYVAAVLAFALARAYWTSPGFEPRQLLHLFVLPPQVVASSEEEATRAFASLKSEFLHIPAVTHVSRAEGGPATGWNIRGTVSTATEGFGRRAITARIKSVDEHYFAALGVPVIHGRGFDRSRDRVDGRSAIINVSLAYALWPDGAAPGRTVRIEDDTYDVVGVCGDFRDGALLAPPSPQIYRFADWGFELLVRVQGAPGPVRDSLTRLVQSRLPGASIRGRTYRQEYWEETASHRARAMLMSGIAVVAVFSAVVGLLVDLLHQLAARRRAVAVVLALGASRRQAFGQLFGRTVRWTCAATLGGLVLGVAGAVMASTVLRDTRAWEFGALLTSVAIIGLGATMAVALPLLRIDPGRVAESLRQE